MHEDMKNPLVSVITPAYNRASFLDETITSVLNQDYPNIEYIILDDGSTDDTLDVIKKYAGRVRWKTHDNMGETRTVNKGIDLAGGEIIVVVNSDDPLLPGAVTKAVDCLNKNSDALVAYPDWNKIGPESELITQIQLPDYNLYSMLKTLKISLGPGNFIRKKAFDIVGMRDTQFKYVGDLEFWFRIALHGPMVHIPEALATHRTHPDAASVTDKGALMADEIVRMIKKVYEHPGLEPEIEKMRKDVFSRIHFKAADRYCGTDIRSRIKHYFASLYFSPFEDVPKLIYNILKSIRRFLRKCGKKPKNAFA